MYTKEKEEGASILYFFTFNEESNTLDETKIGILSRERNQIGQRLPIAMVINYNPFEVSFIGIILIRPIEPMLLLGNQY